MAEKNHTNLKKDENVQIHDAQKPANRMNMRATLRYIRVKLLKAKD